jgi:DNA polymerase-3 subunit delta
MDRPKDKYLIFGDDEFLVEEGIRRVVSHLRRTHGDDLAVDTVDYKAEGLSGFAQELESPSLFSPNKVVVLKHFSLTSTGKTASDIEKYVAADLPEGQYLVLVPAKVDKRLKVARMLAASGGAIECNHLAGEGLTEWIIERFREEGKNATPGVAEALVDLKGDDLRAIDSEITKAVTYVGDAPKVTRKDIELLVGKSRTERVFELVSRVILRKPAEALAILGELLDVNESPIGIVYLLSQEVRRLIIIRLFLDEEESPGGLDVAFGTFKAKVLPGYRAFIETNGISPADASLQRKPYFLYMRFKECGVFALGDLVDLLDKLAEANRLLVSSSESAKVILETVIAGMVTA